MLWSKIKITRILYLSQVPPIVTTKFQKWSLMHMKSLAQVTQPPCSVGPIVKGSCQKYLIADIDLLWVLPVTNHVSLCIWRGNNCAAAQSYPFLDGDWDLVTASTGFGHHSKWLHSGLVQDLKRKPKGAPWVSAALRAVIDPVRRWKGFSHELELVSALMK